MKQILFILTLLISLTTKSQVISKADAIADIDSLVFTLTEVHPDIYGKVGIEAFNKAIIAIKSQLKDSVSSIELYRQLAPAISTIGDAHTTLNIPYNSIMDYQGKFMPIYPTVDSNSGRLFVKASIDNAVPYDSEILSINGISSKQIMDKMKTFVSGEREFFKHCMVDNNIFPLFHLLYPAKQYTVVYQQPNSKANNSVVLQPVDIEAFDSRLVLSPKLIKYMEEHSGEQPYTFNIIENKNIAVMNFDACHNAKQMEAFADSMFNTLNAKGIKTLIIDVRMNGGGDSKVGDALLKHIAPEPFRQFGQTYLRVSPTTRRLGGGRNLQPGIYFFEEDPADNKTPLPADKRFSGKVYLLTSHTTFSSASSFAWAFKKYNCGTVVGEETGGMSVHYGDVLTYTLPHSHLSCNISHKRFWQPGADENNIHGVIPDILVPQEKALDELLIQVSQAHLDWELTGVIGS